ncbi:hypothetical protein ACFY1A_20920 [Streptomyces sp. NPDC001520]|uniref:hypothetical protein n=1 Tax=Streptomyces sp. NPDC001520 TaxID=3364581 RepID=UPI0036AC95FF
MAFGKRNAPGPATAKLRAHVRDSGPASTWTSAQREEHGQLSDAAMREQAGVETGSEPQPED